MSQPKNRESAIPNARYGLTAWCPVAWRDFYNSGFIQWIFVNAAYPPRPKKKQRSLLKSRPLNSSGAPELDYLGFRVSEGTVKPGRKVHVIAKFPCPLTRKKSDDFWVWSATSESLKWNTRKLRPHSRSWPVKMCHSTGTWRRFNRVTRSVMQRARSQHVQSQRRRHSSTHRCQQPLVVRYIVTRCLFDLATCGIRCE